MFITAYSTNWTSSYKQDNQVDANKTTDCAYAKEVEWYGREAITIAAFVYLAYLYITGSKENRYFLTTVLERISEGNGKTEINSYSIIRLCIVYITSCELWTRSGGFLSVNCLGMVTTTVSTVQASLIPSQSTGWFMKSIVYFYVNRIYCFSSLKVKTQPR